MSKQVSHHDVGSRRTISTNDIQAARTTPSVGNSEEFGMQRRPRRVREITAAASHALDYFGLDSSSANTTASTQFHMILSPLTSVSSTPLMRDSSCFKQEYTRKGVDFVHRGPYPIQFTPQSRLAQKLPGVCMIANNLPPGV